MSHIDDLCPRRGAAPGSRTHLNSSLTAPIFPDRLPTVALAAGTRIEHYEVLSAIGAGGMGEVYRATDGRLQRTVAIKFLSTELADASARERFQREAQMTSSLNHP